MEHLLLYLGIVAEFLNGYQCIFKDSPLPFCRAKLDYKYTGFSILTGVLMLRMPSSISFFLKQFLVFALSDCDISVSL